MSENCSCEREVHSSLLNFDRVSIGGHGFAPMYRCRYCGRLYVMAGMQPLLREVLDGGGCQRRTKGSKG